MKVDQHAIFMSTILRDIGKGLLAPAAFQRPYVWTRSDVIALLDSIVQRFPLGSFLTWQPKGGSSGLSARNRLGPVALQTDHRFSRLLLDGQNRLATLAWLTYDGVSPLPNDMSPNEAAVWGDGTRLVVNIEARRFEFRNPADVDTGFTVPAHVLFDSRLLMPLMRTRWDQEWRHLSEDVKDSGLQWLDDTCYAFREAKLIDVVLEDATPQEAKRAFLQICRAGVPMSEEDFDAAIGWEPSGVAA